MMLYDVYVYMSFYSNPFWCSIHTLRHPILHTSKWVPSKKQHESIPSKDDQLSNEEVDLWWRFRWREQGCFPFLQCKCKGWRYFVASWGHPAFMKDYDLQKCWKILFGVRFASAPTDFRFFVEPVKILCRQFPILPTKEYIDVYNDEDKRHLCEDAESFLAVLVSTICCCIHEGVDQIRWVWGFSLSSISLSSAWSYIKTSRL